MVDKHNAFFEELKKHLSLPKNLNSLSDILHHPKVQAAVQEAEQKAESAVVSGIMALLQKHFQQ